MFCRRLILLIFCYIGASYVSAQASIGRSCTTPNRISGICTNINDCPSLLNLLLTQSRNNTVRSYLRSSVCEYIGQTPIVCCPPQKTRLVDDNVSPQNQNVNVTKLPKSPNCGFSTVNRGRIVNGEPAKLGQIKIIRYLTTSGDNLKIHNYSVGEFPWIVALGYRNKKNPDLPRWLCGGSLITNKHVLTAAHCVYNNKDLYLARIGDLDLFSDTDGAQPSSVGIAKVKVHENFNQAKFSNDIAILTLKETVNNPTVWPICMPVDEPYRSMSYLNFSPTLAGWGSVSFNGPSSSTLQEIFVPVLSNQVCERTFGTIATINENILCAGSLNGDKDACGGDSGGPLMNQIAEDSNYRVYQIGIVSYGFKCAQPGYPGVYTRVTAFIDWIEKNLN